MKSTRPTGNGKLPFALALGCAAFGLYASTAAQAWAEQPPPPCHANPNAAADVAAVRNRGDVKFLPHGLQDRLERMASRPHTYLPLQVYVIHYGQ